MVQTLIEIANICIALWGLQSILLRFSHLNLHRTKKVSGTNGDKQKPISENVKYTKL